MYCHRCAGKSFEVKSSKISKKKKKKKEESDLSALENGSAACSKENGNLYTKDEPLDKNRTPLRSRSSIATFMINAIQKKSSRNSLQNCELGDSRESDIHSISVQNKSSASKLGFVHRDSSRTRLIPSDEKSLEQDADEIPGQKNNTYLENGTKDRRNVQKINVAEKEKAVASESVTFPGTKHNSSNLQTHVCRNGKDNRKTSKSVTFDITSHRNNNTDCLAKSSFKMRNNHQRAKGEGNHGSLEQSPESVTCANCTPHFSSTKVKKSSKDGKEDSQLCDDEGQHADETSNSELITKDVETGAENRRKKESWRVKLSKYATRRYFLAVICPCFNYYILKEDENAEKATEKRYEMFPFQ